MPFLWLFIVHFLQLSLAPPSCCWPGVMLWASSPSVSAWVGNDPLCRGECFITALIPGPRTPYYLLRLSRGSTRRGDTFKSCQESQQKERTLKKGSTPE